MFVVFASIYPSLKGHRPPAQASTLTEGSISTAVSTTRSTMAGYTIPRCQKSNCPHRDCPHLDCSCPEASWCVRCTRFWCEDCYDSPDTHHHLDEVVPEHTATQVPLPPVSSSITPSNAANQALQDFQMGLMLLEQENKRRLMMARAEQAAPARGYGPVMAPHTPLINYEATQAPLFVPSSSTPPNRAEQIMRLMVIEQQNKRQLWTTRGEQQKAAAPQAPPYAPPS